MYSDQWLVVCPEKDNVAVALSNLAEGDAVLWGSQRIVLKNAVPAGHRFALCDIQLGAPVLQYGYPFGTSKGIAAGWRVDESNVINPDYPDLRSIPITPQPEFKLSAKYAQKTFQGYRRQDGAVGTRNYYIVLPTSMCASETACMIARGADAQYQGKVSNLDGIVALTHTEGCGCSHNVQIDRLLNVIKCFLMHPNVCGALVVDLGCEQTPCPVVKEWLCDSDLGGRKTDWLSIQKCGGVKATLAAAGKIIASRLEEMRWMERSSSPISKLIVGTECGASDSFSGLTANPIIGNVVDKVISAGGGGILSEFTEMVGAEHLLIGRMCDRKTADKFIRLMCWYKDLAIKLGVDISDNLVPENKAGGLLNSCIKSLGAIMKGGTTPIVEVLDYGEMATRQGLALLQGPGNDIESTTGLVAAGVNIICFSTGKGAITGSAIVPDIKISSNTPLYERMPHDIDFNAGALLAPGNTMSIDAFGDILLEEVIRHASGEPTKTELNGQRQFQVWSAGKLSL
jgi:altronate hydrolase